MFHSYKMYVKAQSKMDISDTGMSNEQQAHEEILHELVSSYSYALQQLPLAFITAYAKVYRYDHQNRKSWKEHI